MILCASASLREIFDRETENMKNDNETLNTSTQRLRPDSLATSVAILLVVSILQRTVGFGRGILFCRWLTPEELGNWDMAYSFLLMASPVVVLGLPGSFGRYVERFRQRGQLRTFLRRSTIVTALLTLLAIVTLVVAAPQFSDFIFGRSDHVPRVILVAACLVAVILHHYLEALFAALRKFRIVSTMQFCQSMSFAVISLGLLWWWRAATESIIVGYGVACLISSVGMLLWAGPALLELAAPDEASTHREFWPPLARFAAWVWMTNLLCHLFAIVDRYMLVHWSGLDNATALAEVGNYHASRIVPLLFISLADLLAGVVMPYLSHDWEAGERKRVSNRLNLVLKMTSLGMMAASVAVLWMAPWLFHVAFQGRYDDGFAVMPWTLAYCLWYALLIVAQNYIWCAERAKLSSVPLATGLALNVVLNLFLIPMWGLLGAVVATTMATAFAVAILYWINKRAGMELQAGTIWMTIAPAALCGGMWPAAIVLAVLVIAVPFSNKLLTSAERELLLDFGRGQWEQLKDMLKRRKAARAWKAETKTGAAR